jgi:hypothetical protein
MDFMIGYFQLLKFVVTALLLYGVYYFYVTKRKKVALWYLLMLVLFWGFAPIKYDGTNTVSYHKAQERALCGKYKDIDSTPKVTVKKSLDDVLKADNLRGQAEQIKINKEIKGN